jgi:DNA-binding CsgD family transcriptional regulator
VHSEISLLERDSQIADLRELLSKVRRGFGQIAVLFGEAGAGKTSLLKAFTDSIAEEARILRGACEDLPLPEPLGPLYDLARDAGWVLARNNYTQRIPLFSEALGVFEHPSRPTVIIVEDLHWADDATLDFVRYLGRRTVNLKIFLLLTARNENSEGQKRARRAFADISAETLTRIDVPLLTEQAVHTLAQVRGLDGSAIYAATAGNAFYVTEWLRSISGPIPPPRVRDAVLTRAERLTPPARAALEAVSIFPRPVQRGLVDKMMKGVNIDIDGCVEGGMLQNTSDGFAFRHEIARRSVEFALESGRRRALNQRLLAVLRTDGGVPAARLVHHALEAGDMEAVCELAPLAAQQASWFGARREAAGHYKTLLDWAQDRLDRDELAQINERYAFECHVIGRINEAIAAQLAARDIHRQSGAVLSDGNSTRWLSRLSWLAGDRLAAEAYGAEAVVCLEAVAAGPELAMAYSNQAQLCMLADRNAEAIAFGQKAIAIARPLSRLDIVAHALINVGTARQSEDMDVACAELESGLKLAVDGGFHEEAARAYTNRGCLEMHVFNLNAAERFLKAGIAYCRDRELDTWTLYMRGHLAEVELYLGRWDEAAETTLLVVDQEDATPLLRFPAVVALARLRQRRGDPNLEPLLSELDTFIARVDEAQRLAPYACLQAERAWLKSEDAAPTLQLLDRAKACDDPLARFDRLDLWRDVLSPSTLPVEVWEQRAETWSSYGAPFEQAVCLSHGNAAAQTEAVLVFDRLGARPYAQHVRHLMRQRGIAAVPRLPSRTGQEPLTGRELEVLELMNGGQSNKAIAKTLKISPKTVDHHVSAILRKLDAASRTQAAAIARQKALI